MRTGEWQVAAAGLSQCPIGVPHVGAVTAVIEPCTTDMYGHAAPHDCEQHCVVNAA